MSNNNFLMYAPTGNKQEDEKAIQDFMREYQERCNMEKKAKETYIKAWYIKTYPTDDLGEEIKEDLTFYDLFEALDHYKDVYDFLGVYDSIIRERLFEELANIMEVGYDYIYEQWLKSAEIN